MRVSRKISRAVVVPAVAAATIGMGAAVAFAHPAPFTVTAGSAAAGTAVPFKGVSAAISFKDTTTGVTLTCSTVTVPSDNSASATKLTVGSSAGSPIADLNAAGSTWTNCLGPAGLKFAVTGIGTWHLNVTDVTAGVATGNITNIRAHVVSTAGPTCSFDAGSNVGSYSGTVAPATVAGTYTNSTKALNVPGATSELALWNVKGGTGGVNTYCVSPAVLKQGDKASFTGTFTVNADNAAYNPIAIN